MRYGLERGSAVMALLGVALLVALLAALLVDVGRVLAARSQVAAAADAAALAAAPVTFRPFGASGTPAQEAARFAAANGARLVRCQCPVDTTWNDREVEVVVEATAALSLLGAVTLQASSRAEFIPTNLPQEPVPMPPDAPPPPR